jgi:hypothetical protein
LCAPLWGLPTAHANLLANGSFESGGFVDQGADTMSLLAGSTVITGWTVVTDTTAWIGPANPFSLLASEGSRFLDLTNYQAGAPFAGVSQTISTVPGATYSLSFDLGGSNLWGRPDSLTASAAGTSATFTTPSTGTDNDWYSHTLQFVANAATTTITLQGQAGINYIGLDNADVELVALPAVPEPQSWVLLALGLTSVVLFQRGRRRRG